MHDEPTQACYCDNHCSNASKWQQSEQENIVVICSLNSWSEKLVNFKEKKKKKDFPQNCDQRQCNTQLEQTRPVMTHYKAGTAVLTQD